jgi:predicted amidohydrolase YtcJ
MDHADLVITGGSVLTMEQAQPHAEAIAVRNGRIASVGTRESVQALAGPGTRSIDLEGGALLPGFVEAHGHPLTEAMFAYPPAADVRPFFCTTYDEVVAKIRARVAQAGPEEFLFFRGLDLVLHRVPKDPTRRELDDWSPQVPIVVQANPGHAAWANSAALERLGITRDTPNPLSGHFVRDANGELTGKATETGVQAFLAPLLAGLAQTRTRSLLDLFSHYASRGLTAVTDHSMHPDMAAMYREAAAAAPVRVRAYARGLAGAVPFHPGEGDDAFRIIGVKLVADGSPWVGNIAVSDPYLNTDTTLLAMGLPRDNRVALNLEDERMHALVERYTQQGWQVSTHAHGDRAIDQVLQGYQRALQRVDARARRFRIEHCGAITDAQIERASAASVLLSFFPAHVYWWGEELRNDLFNLKVAERWMPMGTAERCGMRFSLHNDGMVTPTDPLLNIRTAATRLTRAGKVLGPQQRVSIERALRAHTLDAAHQLFLDHDAGSLAPGKRADLVWLSGNPLDCDPERIHELAVRGTWLAGKPTFQA